MTPDNDTTARWRDIALEPVLEHVQRVGFALAHHAVAASMLPSQPPYLSHIDRVLADLGELTTNIMRWQNTLKAAAGTEPPPDALAPHTSPAEPADQPDPTHDHTPLGRTTNPPY